MLYGCDLRARKRWNGLHLPTKFIFVNMVVVVVISNVTCVDEVKQIPKWRPMLEAAGPHWCFPANSRGRILRHSSTRICEHASATVNNKIPTAVYTRSLDRPVAMRKQHTRKKIRKPATSAQTLCAWRAHSGMCAAVPATMCLRGRSFLGYQPPQWDRQCDTAAMPIVGTRAPGPRAWQRRDRESPSRRSESPRSRSKIPL